MNRQLEYIKVVSQFGSIQKASEKLYVTPSALSKYVQKVEEELNIKLFDRIGKRFVLTYSGERYLYWQEKIRAIQEDMDSELKDLSRSATGRIRIGIQLDDTVLLTTKVLPVFYQSYPKVKVDIIEESSKTLRKLLDDNELDFAILPDYKIGDNFIKRPLAPFNPVLVVSQNNPVVNSAEERAGFPHQWVDFSLLKNERFILPYEGQDAYHIFEQFAADCGFKPRIFAQAKSIRAQVLCAQSISGVVCSSDHLISANFNTDSLVLLSYGNIKMPEYQIIAYHRSHYLERACVYIIELCEQKYGPAFTAAGQWNYNNNNNNAGSTSIWLRGNSL